jgi:DNA ligase-1
MTKTWPTLYKKTSTGAIQFWEIWADDLTDRGEIRTKHGQVGTESPQYTLDVISEGKNLGRKNETSPYEQTLSECQSKWEKQKKKGYVETQGGAEAGELDELIEGGLVPMLAHSYADHSHKIKYPAFVQPKLDGIRCIAILKNGKCTLWSRTRKPITGVPHIQRAIEAAYTNLDITLDGELYNHAFKANFEKIVSFVRQETPSPGHEVVQYHVYDIPSEETFSKRAVKMRYMKGSSFPNGEVQKVDTVQVEDEAEAMTYFEQWRSDGYEGAMIRNSEGKYVNKRSYDLLKMKDFMDSEFEIIGIEEGRGKLSGHVGAFLCKTLDGKEFLAKMSGSLSNLKTYFENPSTWQGKKLTVKYQGLTGANGVPRFPIGIRFRDYE